MWYGRGGFRKNHKKEEQQQRLILVYQHSFI